MTRRMANLWLLVLSLLWALPSPKALAFQNPARFLEDPAQQGGGGQRFFTGSPADGYTCKVCHAPGTPVVHVDVIGLPFAGYIPDTTYPITIDWPDDLKAVGLNLEITDAAGHAAGELSVPPVAQLTAADLCSGGAQSGAGVFPMEQRAVVLVGECGQHQATVVWKAPAFEQAVAAQAGGGTLWFSASLVVSDGDSTVKGDRVTDLRRELPALGAVAPVATPVVATGCHVTQVSQAAASNGPWRAVIIAFWWSLRRRAQRRQVRPRDAGLRSSARAPRPTRSEPCP